ncbi:hypothetical protein [Cohnella terricola]|uniref:Lipoprotein n=1 Tax=Cohnella terricola TaxID=1289167 RepID=A0A559JQS7_9BACL|nr:hypothetical protein [Cohnella terricola]TVY02218.1 hypothetical protein FPZ45_07225 [Cohnella terricola]
MKPKMLLFILAISVMLTGCRGKSATGTETANSSPAIASKSEQSPPSATSMPHDPSAQLDMSKLSDLFAFADGEGKKLITLARQPEEAHAAEKEMQLYNLAIGDNGNVLNIRYAKHQSRTELDNGRQSAHNFSNLEGDIYDVVDGVAKPDASYYLVSDEQFDVRSLIPLEEMEVQDIPADVAQAIVKVKGRAIERGWLLAKTDEGQQVSVVQFKRWGDQMLASLVLSDGDELTFMDYPAQYDANSTWRVDDQSELNSRMFSILFAARTSDGIALGFKWTGAEGENISILKQSGNRFEESGIVSGRYQSPI